MQIGTIIVGLDDSPRAPFVLDAALSIASRHEAKLWIVRAVGLQSPLPPEVLSVRPDDVPAILERTERARLEELLRQAKPEVKTEIVVEVGSASDVICGLAKRLDADMVIVGSHGYRGLDHLLGTTAQRVANTAPCSVLVVRPPMQ